MNVSYEQTLTANYMAVRKRLWGRPLMVSAPPSVRHMPVAVPKPVEAPIAEAPRIHRPLAFVLDVVEQDSVLSSKSAASIIREVCAKHKLDQRNVLGSARNKPVIAARREICWRMRNETLIGGRQISLAEIGLRLGGWDHTTILHHIRTYQKLVAAGQVMQ